MGGVALEKAGQGAKEQGRLIGGVGVMALLVLVDEGVRGEQVSVHDLFYARVLEVVVGRQTVGVAHGHEIGVAVLEHRNQPHGRETDGDAKHGQRADSPHQGFPHTQG